MNFQSLIVQTKSFMNSHLQGAIASVSKKFGASLTDMKLGKNFAIIHTRRQAKMV
jgi:hypothetical protein